METKEKQPKQPKLWYWSQPEEEGRSIEDCEEIVREKIKQRTLVVAFV